MSNSKKDFFNEEYEKALLGCMLLDNTVIEQVQGMLTADAFYTPKGRFLFKAISDDYEENGIANILSLNTRAPKFGAAEIAELTDIGSAANWEFYADKIRQYHIARQLRETLLKNAAEITADNSIDKLQDLDSTLTSYMSYSSGRSTAKDLMPQLVDMMQRNLSNTNMYLGYDTGWESLSEILDGIQTGKLYTIGARPSVGKTALAVQLAANLCKGKVPVAMFSLEMSALSIATRLASLESGIPVSKIQHGWAVRSQANMMRLNNAMDTIYDFDLSIFDSDISDEKELASRIRVEAKAGCKVFILDHLGLLPCSNQSVKRHEQVGIITKKLHHLAQELDIAVVVLCQVNRAAEGKQPTLAELKDSGTIEENSDVVMFIHRERATGGELEIPTDISVVKNRDGKCGVAKMSFAPALTKFTEIKENAQAA